LDADPLTREARQTDSPWKKSKVTRRGFIRSGEFPTLMPQPSVRTSDEAAIPVAEPSRDVRRRDSVYRRLLAVADVMSAAVAMTAVALVSGERLTPAAALFLPSIVLAGKVIGLYDRDELVIHKSTLEEAPKLFQLATLYTLLSWRLDGLIVHGSFGGNAILFLWGLLFAAMLFTRTAVRGVTRYLTPSERCLVVGDAESTDRLRGSMSRSFSLNAELVGRVPLDDEREGHHDPLVLGDLSRLGIVLMEHDVHRVIIAPGARDSERLLDAVRLVKALGMKVSVLPRLFEVVGSSVEFDDVGGMPLLGLRKHGLSQSSRVLKRSLDVVGATVGLFLLAPLLLVAAVAVRLDSQGPVLFRQRRIGRDGEPFEMLKFRTMVDGADRLKQKLRHLNESDGLFKIAADPRITRVGRFLRSSSLDELPQLINVLRGEMSLVGPRPLVEEDDAQIEGWQRRRLGLTPGVTGFWQVLGSSRVPLSEMVRLDYLYAANWSLWLDVKIMLRTIPHVFARRGL
jgi:exopolysaccharide biosynthesis polyprenyl glycosylphosphotransferase